MMRKRSEEISEETAGKVSKKPTAKSADKANDSAMDENSKDYEVEEGYNNSNFEEAVVEANDGAVAAFDQAESDR